jgi:ketosteroid isomerase-like protein
MERAQVEAIVLSFNDCINTRDLDGLSQLMTDDHVLIDTAGAAVSGKSACLSAWQRFFAAFPDYRNVFDRIQSAQDIVAASGRSSCSESRLAGPALWRATIGGTRIREWRVYEDTKDVRRTLGLTAGPTISEKPNG